MRALGFRGMKTKQTITNSSQETIEFAKKFAAELKPGTVLCLEGQLGSGKTTFIKGLAEGLGLKHPEQVKSPTFVLMHIYKAKTPLYHFDCYRLDSSEELENIGFQDFVNDPHAISCVEWAEKAASLLPVDARHIHFDILDTSKRRITIS
jgi:tRNA threonylcarbamoyladenosine biosynthesis protein TsaE